MLAAEIELGVGCLETREPLVGTNVCRSDGSSEGSRPTAFQRGILREDRRMQSLQVGTRLDRQVIHENGSGAGESLERLGLTAGPIQGQHQLTPPPLPK